MGRDYVLGIDSFVGFAYRGMPLYNDDHSQRTNIAYHQWQGCNKSMNIFVTSLLPT